MRKSFKKYFGVGVLGIAILLVGIMMSPRIVQAEEQADNLTSSETVVLEGPVVKVEQKVVIDQYIKGDLIVMARKLKITGVVEGSVYGMAESVELEGQVKGNIHLLARNIGYKAGEIDGSSYTVGQNIVVLNESVIQGSLIGLAQNFDLAGEIKNIFAAGLRLRLSGKSDQASMRVKTLEVDQDAEVAKLSGQYGDGTISEVAKIGDNQLELAKYSDHRPSPAKMIVIKLSSILGWAIGFFILFCFVRRYVSGVYSRLGEVNQRIGINLGIGLGLSVGSILLGVLLLIPYVGWSLIMPVVAIWVVSIGLIPVIAIQLLIDRFAERELKPWEIFGLSLLVSMVFFLPIIGMIARFLMGLISLGVIIRAMFAKPLAKS
ncbi:polymer-forming cytoskeletal protein [Candidatus Nomurabacteria bacterium]|nr:polymer-forming cytoskeletal protein [Candidatus Nomurabacteria bacterium]